MKHDSIRRGEIVGKRVGHPVSEVEHYAKCDACGGYFDMRDLGNVFEHEGPLPHPAQDMSDAEQRIHPDSRFGVGS
jgi:hypothetical protein